MRSPVRVGKAAALSLQSCWHWRVPGTMLVASVGSRLAAKHSHTEHSIMRAISTRLRIFSSMVVCISVWSGGSQLRRILRCGRRGSLIWRPGGVSAFAHRLLLRCPLAAERLFATIGQRSVCSWFRQTPCHHKKLYELFRTASTTTKGEQHPLVQTSQHSQRQYPVSDLLLSLAPHETRREEERTWRK